jgi:hypothetical protein
MIVLQPWLCSMLREEEYEIVTRTRTGEGTTRSANQSVVCWQGDLTGCT